MRGRGQHVNQPRLGPTPIGNERSIALIVLTRIIRASFAAASDPQEAKSAKVRREDRVTTNQVCAAWYDGESHASASATSTSTAQIANSEAKKADPLFIVTVECDEDAGAHRINCAAMRLANVIPCKATRAWCPSSGSDPAERRKNDIITDGKSLSWDLHPFLEKGRRHFAASLESPVRQLQFCASHHRWELHSHTFKGVAAVNEVRNSVFGRWEYSVGGNRGLEQIGENVARIKSIRKRLSSSTAKHNKAR